MQTYLQLWTVSERFNWDAALTLGTCGVVICRMAYRPINYVFTKYTTKLPMGYRIIFGLATCGIASLGATLAVLLLGYWSAIILQWLGFSQGVLWPYSEHKLVPYNG